MKPWPTGTEPLAPPFEPSSPRQVPAASPSRAEQSRVASMGWPYGFPDLSSDEKLLRRQTLDLYACIAHYSALAPLLLFLFYRLGRRLAAAAAPYFSSAPPDFASRGTYDQVPPHSPLAKARRRGDSGSLSARWRRLSWWLRGDVLLCGSHCGQRDEWLLGISYMAWLLVLSIKDTGTGKRRHVTPLEPSRPPIQHQRLTWLPRLLPPDQALRCCRRFAAPHPLPPCPQSAQPLFLGVWLLT